MSDYEITIRARNARILRLIRAQGFDTVRAFCAAHNLVYQTTLGLVVSRVPAFSSDDWTVTTKRLAKALGVQPDVLFTSRQAAGRVKAVTREVNESELIALSEVQNETALLENNPEQEAAEAEKLAAIEAELANLSMLERQVLEMRFGISGEAKTLNEIGSEFGVCGQRIREIEKKALRKIRARAELLKSPLHPFRSCK